MKSPVVSIVVPVYKTERFLAGCLDSILGQTLADIEVLAVDDASPDGCAAILESYARRDARLRVLKHPANRGVAAARNTALEAAAGRYLMFVDSDDRIAPEACARAVGRAEQTGADIVRFGFRCVDESGIEVRKDIRPDATFALDTDADWQNAYRACDGLLTIWSALFRRESIGGARFPPLTHGEDSVFGVECFCRARRIATIPDVLYDYLQHGRSAIHVWSRASFASMAAAFLGILEAVKRNGRYPALRRRMFRTLRHAAVYVLGNRLASAPNRADREALWAIWLDRFRPVFVDSDLVPAALRWWYRWCLRGGSYRAFHWGLYVPRRVLIHAWPGRLRIPRLLPRKPKAAQTQPGNTAVP
jgi:glycosyltransferase involved in cell wall biosynthesis